MLVLHQLSEGALMRYTELIGTQDDYIEHIVITAKYHPCPQCGMKGKRKRTETRSVGHVAVLYRCCWIVAKVGVYQASCQCCLFFQAQVPGVAARGRYSYEVRNTIANALIRDRMPYTLVQRRMLEEHGLSVSLGYLHQCFLWAHEQIDMETHWAFVLANFSGVLCIDEVHDSGRTILFATDPLNNFTVFFNVVDKNDQDHMNAFLQCLSDRGLEVAVAIRDGSPLYKDALQSYWRGVEHQLCIFHVIKEVNKLILDGVRAIKNGLKRQGHKGRKKRRGRPSKRAQQQRERRRGMSKKEQAGFIWEHQYLIVPKEEELSEQDQADLALMLSIAPELERFRRFNQQFYRLFQRDITKQSARYRRTRMVNHAAYHANAFLSKALKKINKEKFNKMIVYLAWENVDRTNNHVERHNRVFRMLQKTRYKRRKVHTIEKAIELYLYSRMLRHPLYDERFSERCCPDHEITSWEIAA